MITNYFTFSHLLKPRQSVTRTREKNGMTSGSLQLFYVLLKWTSNVLCLNPRTQKTQEKHDLHINTRRHLGSFGIFLTATFDSLKKNFEEK